MDVVKAIVLIVLGLLMLWGCGSELVTLLRLRRRGIRTTGVVVGHSTPGMASPGSMQRAGVFEFRTQSGELVRKTSAASTPRGPKVGKQIPVIYDPADPWGTAERPGVVAIKTVLLPLMMVLGVFLICLGVATVS
ncbi:MAG TPA: DUF3592 domain-containing protein [Spirillospora sp.]